MNNIFDFEERKKINEKLIDAAYYIVIGLVSIVSTVFFPMIGSDVDISLMFPDNAIGWTIWIITRLGIALVNIIIFYCFMEQAKVNVKNDKDYIKATEDLKIVKKIKELKPRSPKQFNGSAYGRKGTMLFICSLLSAIALGEAIITFDLIQFLTYIFTVFVGVIFGYLQMRKAEGYWTSEYPLYVQNLLKEEKEKETCLNTEIKNTEICKNK